MLLRGRSGCGFEAPAPTNIVKRRHRGKFLIFGAAGAANYDSSVRMQVWQDLHCTCISGGHRGPVRDYPVTSVLGAWVGVWGQCRSLWDKASSCASPVTVRSNSGVADFFAQRVSLKKAIFFK